MPLVYTLILGAVVTNSRLSRASDSGPRAWVKDAARHGYTQEFVDKLKSAARGGNADALSILATLTECGISTVDGQTLIRRNPARARSLYRSAAELGEPSAMSAVADDLTKDGTTSSQRRQGVALYRAAFRAGNANAALNLAVSYRGWRRYRLAVAWLRRAVAAGSSRARLELAYAELHGIGTPRSVERGIQALERCASDPELSDGDCEEAMLLLASLYATGWLVERDPRKSRTWSVRAGQLT